MNFKKAMSAWAHMCDYTCNCSLCDLKEFCRAEPCTLGEKQISTMESILEEYSNTTMHEINTKFSRKKK